MKAFNLLLLSSALFAQETDLSHLLQDYASSEALYHKTKIESAGHVIVYSRRDLERMQAYKLADVLKTIPFFTLQTSRIGLGNLVKAGASPSSSSPVKIYIDDHEYPSDLRQNIIYRYGNMNLYFVDHIEVYQGGTSIAFGNEVGSMVIRIYTKKAERENATSVQTSGDNRGGYSLSGLSANQTEYFDYLAFASHSDEKYKKYTNIFGNSVSKNGEQQQVHFKFYQEKNWSLDIDYSESESDPYIGFGRQPRSGETKQQYGLIGFTKYFPHKIKLILSTSKEESSLNDYDNGTIPLHNSFVDHLDVNVYNISNKVQLEKRTLFGSNDLLIGLQVINKHAHIEKYKAENKKQAIPNTPKKMDIAMFYAENLYNINKNNLVTLSVKADHYNIDKIKNSNQYSFRLGYIGIYNNKTMVKLFSTRRYIAPRFVQTSFAGIYKPNPNLDVTKIKTITSELQYSFNKKSKLDLSYGYIWIKDPIIFSPQQGEYINKDINTYFARYYIRYNYEFDYNNKLKFEWYIGDREKIFSPQEGALMELFDTFGKVDIYNQLLYRSAYNFNDVHIDASYDYTLGAIYRYSKQLNFKLKGENLFDNASKVPFKDQGISVQETDRRVMATMEYTF